MGAGAQLRSVSQIMSENHIDLNPCTIIYVISTCTWESLASLKGFLLALFKCYYFQCKLTVNFIKP